MGPTAANRLDEAPQGCRQEMAVFYAVPILQPPAQYIKDHEPKLQPKLQPKLLKLQDQSTSEKPSAGFKALEKHVDSNWRPKCHSGGS